MSWASDATACHTPIVSKKTARRGGDRRGPGVDRRTRQQRVSDRDRKGRPERLAERDCERKAGEPRAGDQNVGSFACHVLPGLARFISIAAQIALAAKPGDGERENLRPRPREDVRPWPRKNKMPEPRGMA